MLEAENDMKWAALRPDQKTFDFAKADQVVGFAQVHGMKVRGHTLVWGRSNPPWLTSQHFTPEQLSTLLQEHITRVVSHYRGKVFAWDILNEAFDERGHLRPSIWYDQPGIGLAANSTAYIEQVFRWARAADPEALLFYNDAEGETINVKSDTIYAMVRDFKKERHPHRRRWPANAHIDNLNPDIASIAANIARFTALGVQVHNDLEERSGVRRQTIESASSLSVSRNEVFPSPTILSGGGRSGSQDARFEVSISQ